MKRRVLKFIGFLFIVLFVFNSPSAFCQRPLNIYFPDYVLSDNWFDKVGLYDYRSVYQKALSDSYTNQKLSGSHLPLYSSSFILRPGVLKINVSLGIINSKMQDRPLNEYRLAYYKARYSGYMPHVLPLIYKKEDLADISNFESSPDLDPFQKYQKILAHPGRADTLQLLLSQELMNINLLRQHIYYNYPELVEYDWYELPELPQDVLSGNRLQSHIDREGLEQLFQRGRVSQPRQLEKVKLKTNPWSFSGSENVHFSQAYLKNWVKGGQNSVALLSDLTLKIKYKDEKTEWENTAVHKLGIISSQGAKSRVNDDLIELTSKYGVNATNKWFYSLLFNFRTQFFDGFYSTDLDKLNPISSFMAPAYFSLAAGMDYREKKFTLLLSPLTSRMTMVLDTARIDQTRYNIDKDKKSTFFTGGSLQNNLKWDIAEDINLTSSLNLFYDYFAKDENVQAEWDIILDMRINIFLSTRIVGNFRYYESESDKLQIRQGLSLSFRYNF